jgi:beta-N-acetylhexosaminidase
LPEPFTRFAPALKLARGTDPGLIRDVARAQAEELAAAGFHINFAPVLDVFTNPENQVIGDRAFGATPEEVIHNALPYLQGMTEGGMLGCGKHFPGHGDTVADSHFELPFVGHGVERLRTLELVPFARAIAQGVPMIMTAHVVCPAFDEKVPASLSRTAVHDWLRERMGFAGVIVSDDLEMRAVADHYGIGDAAVRAVRAGSDVVLVCKTPAFVREAHAALARALEAGELDRNEAAASERRRQKLVAKARKAAAARPALAAIGAQTHRQLASRCA